MQTARPEQKQRFAELLERTLAEAEIQPLSREELDSNLASAEQLASEFSLVSKQNHYVLNQVEAEIGSLVSRMDGLDDRYASDIRSALESAVEAIRAADAAVFQVEREIRAQAQRIGWDIHDADTAEISESGVDGVNQEAYDLGYKSYQTRRTACPYKMGTEKQRSWIEGFAAASQENQR